jgi:hypothetical protein
MSANIGASGLKSIRADTKDMIIIYFVCKDYQVVQIFFWHFWGSPLREYSLFVLHFHSCLFFSSNVEGICSLFFALLICLSTNFGVPMSDANIGTFGFDRTNICIQIKFMKDLQESIFVIRIWRRGNCS